MTDTDQCSKRLSITKTSSALIISEIDVNMETELEGFNEYFASSKRMEQDFVILSKQKLLGPSDIICHERRKIMLSGGSVANIWK